MTPLNSFDALTDFSVNINTFFDNLNNFDVSNKELVDQTERLLNLEVFQYEPVDVYWKIRSEHIIALRVSIENLNGTLELTNGTPPDLLADVFRVFSVRWTDILNISPILTSLFPLHDLQLYDAPYVGQPYTNYKRTLELSAYSKVVDKIFLSSEFLALAVSQQTKLKSILNETFQDLNNHIPAVYFLAYSPYTQDAEGLFNKAVIRQVFNKAGIAFGKQLTYAEIISNESKLRDYYSSLTSSINRPKLATDESLISKDKIAAFDVSGTNLQIKDGIAQAGALAAASNIADISSKVEAVVPSVVKRAKLIENGNFTPLPNLSSYMYDIQVIPIWSKSKNQESAKKKRRYFNEDFSNLVSGMIIYNRYNSSVMPMINLIINANADIYKALLDESDDNDIEFKLIFKEKTARHGMASLSDSKTTFKASNLTFKTVDFKLKPLDDHNAKPSVSKKEVENSPTYIISDVFLFATDHLKIIQPVSFTNIPNTTVFEAITKLSQKANIPKQYPLLIYPPENTDKYPTVNITTVNYIGAMKFLDNVYGIYPNGLSLFLDYDKVLIADKFRRIGLEKNLETFNSEIELIVIDRLDEHNGNAKYSKGCNYLGEGKWVAVIYAQDIQSIVNKTESSKFLKGQDIKVVSFDPTSHNFDKCTSLSKDKPSPINKTEADDATKTQKVLVSPFANKYSLSMSQANRRIDEFKITISANDLFPIDLFKSNSVVTLKSELSHYSKYNGLRLIPIDAQIVIQKPTSTVPNLTMKTTNTIVVLTLVDQE